MTTLSHIAGEQQSLSNWGGGSRSLGLVTTGLWSPGDPTWALGNRLAVEGRYCVYGCRGPAGLGLLSGSYSCLSAQPCPTGPGGTAHTLPICPASLPLRLKNHPFRGLEPGTRQQEMPGPALPRACPPCTLPTPV